MKCVLDKGHQYQLLSLDGEVLHVLTFVKRCDPEGHKYPGNKNAYPGTTVQSVVRCLLERMRYLQNQVWALENVFVILCLRLVLWFMEFRAARRHGKFYCKSLGFAENAPMCPSCGHTFHMIEERLKGKV